MESLEHVVMFADLLGFAALTEANAIDVRMLRARERLGSMTVDDLVAPSNPLTEAFTRFHQAVKWQIMMAEWKFPITAITFSDSAFIATAHLWESVSFAAGLSYSLLSQRVPIRVGIALGSFAALRFRSDIGADGGDHAAQFLGTAVVRAYQTEKCGIKGMRVLLHPSLEPLLSDSKHNPSEPPVGINPLKLLEVSNKESANQAGVRYELNYWDMAPTKEGEAWHALQDMWASAPAYVQEQYRATAEAVGRMREAQGEAPLTNLRRRTLPRGTRVKPVSSRRDTRR